MTIRRWEQLRNLLRNLLEMRAELDYPERGRLTFLIERVRGRLEEF